MWITKLTQFLKEWPDLRISHHLLYLARIGHHTHRTTRSHQLLKCRLDFGILHSCCNFRVAHESTEGGRATSVRVYAKATTNTVSITQCTLLTPSFPPYHPFLPYRAFLPCLAYLPFLNSMPLLSLPPPPPS